MASRFLLEIIDRKLKEIMKNESIFGGKILILSGDFRQCLPIKEFATRSEITDLTIKKSNLWNSFLKLKLTENMRADKNEKEFAKNLIEIGDGKEESEYITIHNYAILSPFNTIVDKYNEEIIKKFPGEQYDFLSIDETEQNSALQITPEILNSLNCANFPKHKLTLKINSVIMLLRNLNLSEGLCNGTRLQVTNIGKNVLNCKIISGDKFGEQTLIPRITLIEEKKFPFILKRHQFPVQLAFSFTINKSQSQTFEKIGIDFTQESFAHGQTYVALSRAKSWNKIKIKLNENENKIKI
uniref:ATP-dependent DNA helicase n=1 Tax=Meloidogyne enterolobii TaxID=390850 RepID=A0A6V7VG37_MELEN|nr:unnamed protein product [Meloidogyne enterolobii]